MTSAAVAFDVIHFIL
ncbi:hypothetical protein CGLO_18022 [Colletotrichum gloeosporioides Cg-14]|uniref:Uncharacterized protein n=1 Tax=Colletotrichum gloeosporioides (strain Cg-14) TaxID=1237896 RepID=T0JIT9_COLGC|nr:hypothetical protein CGLO_18022 [Colletotrichum gloeosporioides Cg-14]